MSFHKKANNALNLLRVNNLYVLQMSFYPDDIISVFIQVSVCFETTRTFPDSVSQTGLLLPHVVLAFVTMVTPFVIQLHPVRLYYPVNAPFILQMTNVVQFSNALIAVSGTRFVMSCI